VRISGSILLSTVSNFLDYFKLEAGKSLDIIRTPFNISTLVGDVHRIIEAMIGPDKNVDLVSPELKDIPLSVVGDPARVCGILLNMYVNAAKFTREGSIRLIVHAVNKQYRPRPNFSNECCNGILSEPGPRSVSSPSIECQTKNKSTPGVNITVREEQDGWMAAESDIKCEVGSSVGGDVNDPDADTCWVAFEVHDTGIGITPKSLRALFRDYVQGDEQEEQQKDKEVAGKRQSGTGLGLAICSRQVALLGGALGALSKPGSGSVFWFKIPMKLNNRPAEHVSDCCRGPSSDVAAQSVSQSQDRPTPCLNTEVCKEGDKDQEVSNSNKTSTQEMMDDDTNNRNGRPPLANVRVLLVEDNMINRKVTSHVLRSLGGVCETASNGQEAIDLVGENVVNRWDIILMDMCMPVLGGVDATRRLRELGCRIPIVAMTANASNKDKEECLSAGMDGFLSKPVLRNELAQCIYKHIQLSSRASSGSSDTWTWS
jgi:CheY-like chemotaxis protein/signal transduction histidine kinase